ncbi:ABC transporter ATP-binding protein [Marinomonas rhizomae]|uniref:Carbohydrate ABC transporter ATP-binding protein (CUT1 family) n=1 Tax=Marinomonas rhizomae TaxID=491948 RepID=A0A366JDI2_9GAMM|nr:ABC transporter ATP-binding protein [Marinomonas rhizomae]RBP85022.1 carbohydrate ABC transporter ATP-binding protein (CUT1 family) [Marinomonas rhizomae]RNF76137.1 ABC transporter ATP-binding protein [Marinomonas rhizomae]
MARLILDGVEKSFHGAPVVKDLNLTIEPGEFVALLGPSGCGKSTILRMLAGFESVSEGQIIHGDECLSSMTCHVPTEERNFGMVFQSYALWPHMTVKENVAYPLKVQKTPMAERRKRVKEALEIVQLEEYADRLPAQLSGGQRQRVALARSLVTEPDVVLFDEPLANLDRHLRATMEETFRAFHKRTGATMVYVTHDQSEAMSLADKIAVLKKGQLVQWGTPQELYATPKNTWLANFIGRGSVLSVAAVAPQEYVNGAKLYELICQYSPEKTASSVLVRPQDIEFVSSHDAALEVRVYSCIFRGERYDIELTLNDGQRLLAYSDIPMTLENQHFVRLGQAWSLESES